MNSTLSQILVIDIETIRSTATYIELSERMKKQWEKKAFNLRNLDEITPDEMYMERAGIYAEFGQVIVISIGFYVYQEEEWHFRVRSLSSDNEKQLLEEFIEVLGKFNPKTTYLCGHNGKEFDFPYVSRRLLVNGLPLPELLDTAGKKPWEVNHIDTMELWKFGDRKNYTSLDLLAALFEIPSSKSDIDGSQVSQVYYEENDSKGVGLERIAEYCARDVVVTAQLLLKLKGQPLINEKNIHIVE
jgi:3'-5' exonuclease